MGQVERIRTHYQGRELPERPFFIPAEKWLLFTAIVTVHHPIAVVAGRWGITVHRARQVLQAVHAQLSLPRPSEREWKEITPHSPIDDLNLSVRTSHKVRERGCKTVEDVLRLDLSRIGGRASRAELIGALRRCGFQAAGDGSDCDLEKVRSELHDIGQRMENDLRGWRQRLLWIESKLNKLSAE